MFNYLCNRCGVQQFVSPRCGHCVRCCDCLKLDSDPNKTGQSRHYYSQDQRVGLGLGAVGKGPFLECRLPYRPSSRRRWLV